MKYIFFYLSILCLSCSDKTEQPLPKEGPSHSVYRLNKNQLFDKTDRAIINEYQHGISHNNRTRTFYPFSKENLLDINDQVSLQQFKKLIDESEETGYCCCPEMNLEISFYNKNNKFISYLVDTLTHKDDIQIFHKSFQYSYLINRNKWKDFTKSLNKLSAKLYHFSNLHEGRKVFNYCTENNLPVITSNRCSKYWMFLDGHFYVKVADIGKEIQEKDLYDKIALTYPKDSLFIETASHSKDCYEGCYEEYILKIYSNKTLHDNFNIYQPKTAFDKAYAEFYLLGVDSNFMKLDKTFGLKEEL